MMIAQSAKNDTHRAVLCCHPDSAETGTGCSMRSDCLFSVIFRGLPLAFIITTLGAPALAEAASNDSGSLGTWQAHKYEFHFMGVTSTYSCDGLGDKLQLLLRLTGARGDMHVAPLCARGFGVPDKLAEATIIFSSLQPAADGSSTGAGSTVSGVWRHVELSTDRPRELRDGDCELMEQFRDSVLPMFATRNVQTRGECIPNQASGFFSLQFDVFAATGDKAH
jgi:hypothetical protein